MDYDVLVVDRMLPRRDGLSLIAGLRSRGNTTPVLILSALGAVFFLPALAGRWDLSLLLNVAYYALELAAVACLFRPDATAWLKGKPDTDQATLD